MDKKNKELLLMDLSGRLPYRPFVRLGKKEVCVLTGIDGDKVYLNIDTDSFDIESIKPILRPMSSMTEEEKEELKEICSIYIPSGSKNIGFEDYGILVFTHHLTDNSYSFKLNLNAIDWLNKKMFDYRTDEEGKTMIEKGLALQAPENMYK